MAMQSSWLMKWFIMDFHLFSITFEHAYLEFNLFNSVLALNNFQFYYYHFILVYQCFAFHLFLSVDLGFAKVR